MPLKLALPLTALFFLQCAGGYTPPSANPTVFTYDIPLAKTALFAKAYPERFFDMGVAEQDMISTAAGLALTVSSSVRISEIPEA